MSIDTARTRRQLHFPERGTLLQGSIKSIERQLAGLNSRHASPTVTVRRGDSPARTGATSQQRTRSPEVGHSVRRTPKAASLPGTHTNTTSGTPVSPSLCGETERVVVPPQFVVVMKKSDVTSGPTKSSEKPQPCSVTEGHVLIVDKATRTPLRQSPFRSRRSPAPSTGAEQPEKRAGSRRVVSPTVSRPGAASRGSTPRASTPRVSTRRPSTPKFTYKFGSVAGAFGESTREDENPLSYSNNSRRVSTMSVSQTDSGVPRRSELDKRRPSSSGPIKLVLSRIPQQQNNLVSGEGEPASPVRRGPKPMPAEQGQVPKSPRRAGGSTTSPTVSAADRPGGRRTPPLTPVSSRPTTPIPIIHITSTPTTSEAPRSGRGTPLRVMAQQQQRCIPSNQSSSSSRPTSPRMTASLLTTRQSFLQGSMKSVVATPNDFRVARQVRVSPTAPTRLAKSPLRCTSTTVSRAPTTPSPIRATGSPHNSSPRPGTSSNNNPIPFQPSSSGGSSSGDTASWQRNPQGFGSGSWLNKSGAGSGYNTPPRGTGITPNQATAATIPRRRSPPTLEITSPEDVQETFRIGDDSSTATQSGTSTPQRRTNSPGPTRFVSPTRAQRWLTEFESLLRRECMPYKSWVTLSLAEKDRYFTKWRLPQLQRKIILEV